MEDALYSKWPTLINATTITSVVVVGTHLTFLALLPSLTRTPFRVSSLNAAVNVYTCSSFTTTFTSNKPSHLASASQQTPLTAFHSLSLFCFLEFFCDENCLFITNRETLMNLLKKNGFDGLL